MSIQRVEIRLGATPLVIETGKIAKQADGSVTVRMGDTVVLVATCMAPEPRDVGFMPLTCEYREFAYAGGKFPGGFFRREARPNEKETLTARLIDRPIRPGFPEGFAHETQVIAHVISYDGENDPQPLAMCGASAALYCSKLPWETPLGTVRVGRIDGEFVINPTKLQMAESDLDMLMACSEDAITMVEAGAREVGEDVIINALEFGHDACRRIIAGQRELFGKLNPVKFKVAPPVLPEQAVAEAKERIGRRLADALHAKPKRTSYAAIDDARKALVESYPAEDVAARKHARAAFEKVLEELFRDEILKDRKRSDGRSFTKIRPITCETGFLPRTHGSALFTRGETQALVNATLGTAYDAQKMDWLEGEWTKRFMLHYNFPPFSVGEVKPLRGTSRREIGHGALAERALKAVMPAEDAFPYTVRIVSDILESNGSSSMASICGGTLALMDAGVPISAPVAGIAMGLVSGEGHEPAILTDIAGQEDHHGDMDFKVAGTRKGITALQMDIKIAGLSRAIMGLAMEQARVARLEILDTMDATLATPRVDISKFAPRIISLMVPRDKIATVIGPGGKTIRSIVERTGVKIDIGDDGRVNISSIDEAAAAMAKKIVEDLTAEAEVGRTYLGRVVRIMDFGAFVEILPGMDGLLHVSEMAEERVNNVRDVVEEGDEVLVKVIEVDGTGRVRLSRRAALRDAEGGGGADGGGDAGGERRDDRPEGGGDRGGDRGPRGPRGPGGGGGGRPGGGGGRDRGPRR
jgi:polyribonucleotide nucleotidyltransferase